MSKTRQRYKDHVRCEPMACLERIVKSTFGFMGTAAGRELKQAATTEIKRREQMMDAGGQPRLAETIKEDRP